MEILIFCDFYLPGYKSGGPIKSISNLVHRLGKEFTFRIVTRDRDRGDSCSYPQIDVNRWQQVGQAEVIYLTPDRLSLMALRKIIASTPHDILYLNSFFSPVFAARTLLLRRFGLIRRKPLILAPRGEFARGALDIKAYKKRPYLVMARLMRLYCDVIWHVSSEREQADILRRLALTQRNERVQFKMVIAQPLSSCDTGLAEKRCYPHKQAGTLRIIFLSRISRMKNLDFALSVLRDVKGSVTLHIYGPFPREDDKNFWSECQQLIHLLPDNIQVKYCGATEANQVVTTLARYDLFFLPTLGENFGHVILEALVAGCPVLISDRTPWRDLEAHGAGWSLPLEQPERFTTVLQSCVDMGAENFAWARDAAFEYGRQHLENETAVEQNRALFHQAAALVSK